MGTCSLRCVLQLLYNIDMVWLVVRHPKPKSFQWTIVYDILCSDAKKPLYIRCTNFTSFFFTVLRLINLKVRSGWSDKIFTELFELLKNMLLKGNTLLNHNYENYKCPKCEESWYKRKMVILVVNNESRNLRITLAIDGMNNNLSNKYFMACFVGDLLHASLVVHEI
ncbi:hypothetical protein CR513_55027, partial [Mucuna pruriens]